MSATSATDDVKAFLASYRDAFERFDARDLANHFAFPCHISSEAAEVALLAIPDKHVYVATIAPLLDMYRSTGVHSGEMEVRSLVELSARLMVAVIGWWIKDRGGQTLYMFDSVYTLVRQAEAWRICAIAHNEMPKLRGLRAR